MATKTRDEQFDLEFFFKLAPDLLCITGYDGYFKKINPAVSRVLGYSHSELLASPITSFIHPNDRELSARKHEALVKGELLFRFENRFLTKQGSTVWLFWTAVPIKRDKLIFAIAKDVTLKKRSDGPRRVSAIFSQLNTEQMKRFSADIDIILPVLNPDDSNLNWMGGNAAIDHKDQLWLNKFEALIRHYAVTGIINLKLISTEMANSERQLFREVKRIMGTTPNKLVRTIRLQMAWEAISSGKYRTLSEITTAAGYTSTAHFKKLFQQVYGIDVSELL